MVPKRELQTHGTCLKLRPPLWSQKLIDESEKKAGDFLPLPPSQNVVAAGLPQRGKPVHLQATAARDKQSHSARSSTQSHCKICISLRLMHEAQAMSEMLEAGN